MNISRGIACIAAFGVLATGAGGAAAAAPQTLVVDDDRAQCAGAGFTSIQAAVDAAQPGGLIRVCPGLYAERVTIDKPLTLKADPDAIEALDCFQPTLPELTTNQHAIVDPAGDAFATAFTLRADGVMVGGFVVQGTSVGIDASDSYSGYRLHHNLIWSNTLFAVDFGSDGTQQSRVDHNCIRQNRFGLGSELDNDAVWPDLGNRIENARNLINARVDHNATFQNRAGLEAAGPGRHDRVSFEGNVSRGDRDVILIQNSDASAIVDNQLSPTRFGIGVGGATTRLAVRGNRVEAGLQGIVFVPPSFFIDQFPTPVTAALVSENIVIGQTFDGMVAAADRLHDSLLLNNVTSDNARDGIILRLANSGNTLRGNIAERNGEYGIYAQGASSNVFEANRMLGNGVLDARDDAPLTNAWIANECLTDFPTGTICEVG